MQLSDRRLARRFPVAMPVHFSVWNSSDPEELAESVNISERGTYFETLSPLGVGATLRLRIEMPEEVTGVPAAEWRCIAKVVRIVVVNKSTHRMGVGIRLDFYEIIRAATPQINCKVSVVAAGASGSASRVRVY